MSGRSKLDGAPVGSGRYRLNSGKDPRAAKRRGGSQRTVFVSGSSKTQNQDSPYYRRALPKSVRDKLDSYISDNAKVIVGDAPGIDRQVQNYLNKKQYANVEVYGPGKNVRYLANKKWVTHPIDAPEYEEGSKEWLAKKDIAMEKASTEGLAIVLDEGAKATRKNVDRLRENNKQVSVLQLSKNGKDHDEWLEDIKYQLGHEFIADTFNKHRR